MEIVSLADDILEFMEIESISGNEGTVGNWLLQYLKHEGFSAELEEVKPNRYNIVSNLDSGQILFCSHIDTVPPYIAPRLENGIIYGRGGCDAKGVIIAQIAVAKYLVENKIATTDEIAFAYVIGEETDHIGAKHLGNQNFSVKIGFVGEPTRNLICSRGMGLLKISLQTTGKAGHSAFPTSGFSAVHELVALLSRLEETVGEDAEFHMGTSLYNIGLVEGGTAANVHAPSASATVLYRLAEPSDSVLERLTKLLSTYTNTEMAILSQFEPILLSSLDGMESDIARFNSDAMYLKDKSKYLFLMGPGDIRVAHSKNEQISLKSVESGIEAMVEIVKKLQN